MIAQKYKGCRIPLLYSLYLLRKATCRGSWASLHTVPGHTKGVGPKPAFTWVSFRAGFAASSTEPPRNIFSQTRSWIACQTLRKQFSTYWLGQKTAVSAAPSWPPPLWPQGFGSACWGRFDAFLCLSHRHILFSVGVHERVTGSSPFTCPETTHLSKNLSIIGVTPPPCAFPLTEGSWKKGWVMRR